MMSEWKAEFAERFSGRAEELEELYLGLYHGDTESWEAFQRMLYRAWEERPESLRKEDRERAAFPEWYRGHNLTGMQMYADAFAGNLAGVRKKLDYIADCGVNCLHLMPLLESPEGRSDGGYAVSDFRKVQKRLGTMEDLSALAEECRRRGISLCLDFVMNHTSEDHEWARRARAGEAEYQRRYFMYDGWDIPNMYEQTMPQVFPRTAPGNFTWCGEARKLVMTTFWPYQWDLNYANPAVFNDMTDNMLNLCNHGADIIRLDAVPYIWKAPGTSCRNLPQVHRLVRMMRLACEIVCPGTLLLGEVVMAPGEVAPYFGTEEKPECHLLYNVTMMASLWHTVATRDTRLISHQLEQLFSLPKQYMFLNYLRCHDDIGWGLDYGYLRQLGMEEIPHKRYLNDYLTGKWTGSPARGELYNEDAHLGDARLCGTTASLCGLEAAREKGDPAEIEKALALDIMLHAFIFTLSGLPVIYSGDEIGAENDYGYREDPLLAADSRNLHRGAMNWDRARMRKRKTTVEGKLFSALKQLEELRAGHPAFDMAADTWLPETGNGQVLGIGRYYQGEKLIALFNFSDEPQIAWIRGQEPFVSLTDGKQYDSGAVRLPAGGFVWLSFSYGGNDAA